MQMKLSSLFALVAGVVLFAAPSLAATNCDTSSEVDIPELHAANIGNGHHVVARANTPRGELQVRVTVKGKQISEPNFYIGQKRMKRTSMRRVPKDIRDCLDTSQKKVGSSAITQLAFMGPLEKLRLYSPRADIAFRGRCTVTAKCNQSICCALAKCGGGADAVWCVGF
jgi:hypothetical protein